jgi:hypothetical protein
MFEEINAGFSVLSGKHSPIKKNKTVENVINMLVYQRRKKTAINKAG